MDWQTDGQSLFKDSMTKRVRDFAASIHNHNLEQFEVLIDFNSVTFCPFPTIFRSRSLRSDAFDSADPEGEERISRRRRPKMESIRQIEWRKSRKRRKNLRLDGGRGGARAAEVLTSGQDFWTLSLNRWSENQLRPLYRIPTTRRLRLLLFHCYSIAAK